MSVPTWYEAQRQVRIRQDGQMLKWLRRQLNADLRAAYAARRADPSSQEVEDQVASCRALLDLLRVADNWHATAADPEYRSIQSERDLVLSLVRRFALAYQHRPGYRAAWEPR